MKQNELKTTTSHSFWMRWKWVFGFLSYSRLFWVLGIRQCSYTFPFRTPEFSSQYWKFAATCFSLAWALPVSTINGPGTSNSFSRKWKRGSSCTKKRWLRPERSVITHSWQLSVIQDCSRLDMTFWALRKISMFKSIFKIDVGQQVVIPFCLTFSGKFQ